MMLHSITATYPDFQALPKGVKQMLLVSESMFFDEARVMQTTTHVTHHPLSGEGQTGPGAIRLANAGEQYRAHGATARAMSGLMD